MMVSKHSIWGTEGVFPGRSCSACGTSTPLDCMLILNKWHVANLPYQRLEPRPLFLDIYVSLGIKRGLRVWIEPVQIWLILLNTG